MISFDHISPEEAAHLAGYVEQLRKAKRDAEQLRENCLKNFRCFVAAGWHIVEPAHEFRANWHIDAIADHLQAVAEGSLTRLLINIGPGMAKSLVVSVLWPAWLWLVNPRFRQIYSSYAADLSLRDAVRSRSLIESPWYRETFKPTWKLSGDQNVKSYYENTEKGSRISISVGGQATGYRADVQVCDDPIHARDQFSDRALEECVFWWDQVMSSRLNDPVKGARVIIMQRLSDRDLSAHVLSQGGYEHLCLPTEFEPERRCSTSIGWTDPRQDKGELLFPSLFPEKAIEDAKRDLGEAGYAGQHQQRPMPVGGGMLKAHWWNYWQPKGANLPPVKVRMPNGDIDERKAIPLPSRFDQVIQSWDMTFKDTKHADFVVGQVHAACGADRFILDQSRGKMDLPATVLEVRKLSARWPNAVIKLVEDKANGPAVVQSLRHEIGGFVEVNPEGGKVARAAGASPQLEGGNWYVPHPLLAPWVEGFIAECSAFPAGANDDQVDSWSQGAKRLLTIKERPKRKPAPPVSADSSERGWMT